MTITAKNTFVAELEDVIGEYLTGSHTKRVLKDVRDGLDGYELEPISTDYKPCEDDVIQAYLSAKTIEGKSPKTIARYSYILEKAFQAIGAPPVKVTTDQIRDYMAAEKNRGLSGHSLEGLRQCLSAFFNWIWREGYIQRSPMGNIGSVKYKAEIKTPYSALEIEKIKGACKDTRETALIYFLLTTGCRVDEVRGMNIDSVNLEALEVKVLGKGNKERIVYLTAVSAMMLQRYLAERTDTDAALFVGKRGRLTTNGIRCILNGIEERSGVSNVHPHRFRRTLATMLIDRGMSIQDVAKILGHANINTTLKYIYSDKANVKHSYQKFIA